MPITAPPVVTPPATPTDTVSADGFLRAVVDPVYDGVKLQIDYTLDTVTNYASPFQCVVYRTNPDGSTYPVRGGNPWINYGRRGWLYDQECPLGANVSYFAVPVLASGLSGPASANASVMTSAPKGGGDDPGLWLVSLESPAYSVQARSTDGRGLSYPSRSSSNPVLGSKYLTATTDTRGGLATKQSVLTLGQAEFNAMKALVDQNYVMRRSIYWDRPDGYFLISDVSANPAAGLYTNLGGFIWDLTLAEVDQPSTYGQLPSFPGRNFADRRTAYPTFATVPYRTFGRSVIDEATGMFESGVTAWTAGANTTRSVDTTNFKQGSQALRLTATASGYIYATCTNQTVLPNTAYEYSGWFFTPAAGPAVNLELWWKDAVGNTLFQDSMSLQGKQVSLGAAQWTYILFKSTSPANAQLVTPVIGGPTYSAAGYLTADIVRLEPAP